MTKSLRTVSKQLQRFNNHWFDTDFSRVLMPTMNNWMNEFRTDQREWLPQTDISETDSEIKIAANLPGLKKEDVKIEFDSDTRTLSLQGEFNNETKNEDEHFHSIERSHGRFERSIRLPRNADAEKITASMEDGVLHVGIPKTAEKAQPSTRQISIE
jgi:HSP20 family protein